MRIRNLILVVSMSCLGPAAFAGNVLVVDATGAGAITQLQAAVNAASDGDTLLVKPGNYAGFSVANKALDVVADTSSSSGPAHIDGAVQINGLAAARAFTLTGFEIRGPVSSSGVRLASCAGSVRVQGCAVRGGDAPACSSGFFPNGYPALEIDTCADVVVTRCSLRGSNGGTQVNFPYSGYAGYGREGLYGRYSQVAVYDSTLIGGDGGAQTPGACVGASGYGGGGGRAATASGCVPFFASGCTFRGGAGGVGDIESGWGGVGLEMIGAPGPVWSRGWVLDSSLLGGASACAGCPPAAGSAASPRNMLSVVAGTARRRVAPTLAREQNLARLNLEGQPGDRVEVWISERPRFAFSPSWSGVLHVDAHPPASVLQAGIVGANGVLVYAWPVSELGPVVESRRVFLQAAFIDASGQATLGTPHTLVLLDSSF